MRFFRLLWLAVMLSGCIPYSDNPLTAPDNEDPDPAIRGTWFFYEDGETVFLHIGIDEKTKQLRLVMVEFQKDHEVKTSELVGHISRLKNNTYLNLRWDRSEDQGLGYLFVKYQIAEERLGLGLIRSDPVEMAIREGKIQGQITQNPSSVRLTDSSEKLQGYVQEHDRIVFEELKWMNRWIPSQNPVGAFIGQNGEDIILKKRQEFSETIYSLGDESCALNLTVYASEAEKLPFYEALKMHGVRAKDKLPFDCQAWFSIVGQITKGGKYPSPYTSSWCIKRCFSGIMSNLILQQNSNINF